MTSENDKLHQRFEELQLQEKQYRGNNNNNASDTAANQIMNLGECRADEWKENHSGDSFNGSSLNARSNVNDLLADLCLSEINGTTCKSKTAATTELPAGFGVYTNLRTQLELTTSVEGTFNNNSLPTTVVVSAPAQNTSFSFKHFLSNSGSGSSNTGNIGGSIISSTSSSTSVPTISLQTSTGARPKVPQSASGSVTSISSLSGGGLSLHGSNDSGINSSTATKMKRSPRFSSFDSQASLAEYAAANNLVPLNNRIPLTHNDYQQYAAYTDSADLFPTNELDAGTTSLHNSSMRTAKCGEHERRSHVPRSYSNYDMPLPPASPRRRIGNVNAPKEQRPNRLALDSLKLDLNFENDHGAISSVRAQSNNTSGAAALPDFVQDHLMEPWYTLDMHCNSQSSSPLPDLEEVLTVADAKEGASVAGAEDLNAALGAAVVTACCDPSHGGNVDSSINCRVAAAVAAAAVMNRSANADVDAANGCNSSGVGASKMLPDFLSDDPIIHSSQRMADVAAGLPSNPQGSPEDQAMSRELLHMRQENDRLRRQLSESRCALKEQLIRGDELQKKLSEYKQLEPSHACTSCATKRVTTGVSNFNPELQPEEVKLSIQPKDPRLKCIKSLRKKIVTLTDHITKLRNENQILREMTGLTDNDEIFPDHTSRNCGNRPSTKKLSDDLMKAAADAESNLRHLLKGVDELRQISLAIKENDPYDVFGEFEDSDNNDNDNDNDNVNDEDEAFGYSDYSEVYEKCFPRSGS